MKIHGIISAAGFARRMGANKLLLPFKGKALARHVIDLALSLPLASVVLVSTEETARGLDIPPGVRLVINAQPEAGQSLSMRLGLLAVKETERPGEEGGRLFFAADQPLLDAAAVLAVLAEADSEHIIAPAHAGRPGNPVFFPAKFDEELLAVRGDTGGRAVRERHPESLRLVEVQEEALRDVDEPEHYALLLRLQNE